MENSKALVNSIDVPAGVERLHDERSSADWNAAMRRFYNVFPYPGRPLLVLPQVEHMALSHLGFASLLASGEQEWARKAWRCFHPGARIARGSSASPRSRADARLARQVIEAAGMSTEPKRLLLAGCGTDEAVLYGALHPKAQIDAVDLSARSLMRARLKWGLYCMLNPATVVLPLLRRFRLGNVMGKQKGQRPRRGSMRFVCSDVMGWLDSGKPNPKSGRGGGASRSYDHIVCFGVLHHQLDPRAFFEGLVRSLQGNGTIRMMIYSRSGRSIERLSQRLFSRSYDNGDRATTYRPPIVRIFFRALMLKLWIIRSRLLTSNTASHRFRYLGIGTSLAPVADALLHPCDPGLDPELLGKWISQSGLRLVYCAAKSGRDGWLVGIDEPMQTWDSILERERAADLISNIELIVAR
jgi:SAM-dependent methyltransferase